MVIIRVEKNKIFVDIHFFKFSNLGWPGILVKQILKSLDILEILKGDRSEKNLP